MKKKWLGYLRGGFGDMMAWATQLNQFLSEKNLSTDDFHWLIDSHYFLFPDRKIEKETIEIILSIMNIRGYEIVPKEFSSCYDLDFGDGERQAGMFADKKYNFGFWRFHQTIPYMRDKFENCCEGNMLDCPYVETMATYNQTDGYNRVNYDKRAPLPGEDVSAQLPPKYILMYFKVHGLSETVNIWESIVDISMDNKVPCVIIGYNDLKKRDSDLFIDLRLKLNFKQLLSLTLQAPGYIGSGTAFSFQRMAGNSVGVGGPSLYMWPYHKADPFKLFPVSYHENDNNIFMSADKYDGESLSELTNKIIEKLEAK